MASRNRKFSRIGADVANIGRVPLDIKPGEWLWPVMFMLSMIMIGLNFPLGYLAAPVIIISQYRKNMYNFVIMLTIFVGGYGFMSPPRDMHFDIAILVFFAIFVCMLVVRKVPILKKAIIACLVYYISLLLIASTSDESMLSQLHGPRTYLLIGFFIIPVLAFSGKDFDMKRFMRQWYVYVFIVCICYILDATIMGGPFFFPRDPSMLYYDVISTFYSPKVHLFSFSFQRIWPLGLFMMIPCIYPTARYYKLTKWQWLLVGVALYITRTFTFLLGLVLCYLVCKGHGKKVILYIGLGIVAFVGLYFVDTMLPYSEENKQSTLRIQSSVDQIINFDITTADDEDLAELGSTRGAQIIPKMELLYSLHREWLGLGFLSRDKTTNQKYIIENDLYNNPEDAEEVATGVESMPFQVILSIGYIGLIIHVLFFIYLWWIVRKLPDSAYYVCTAMCFVIIGISGFSGLIAGYSLYILGTVFAAVILAQKRKLVGFSLPPEKNFDKREV